VTRGGSGARRAVVLTLLAAAAAGCGEAVPHEPHPIILVDIDTLGAKHLGTYGYGRATSPHIDAFAQEAIRFERAYAQAPNTPPSQTSILTGLYPSTHGMIEDDDRVPQEATTLAEALRARGFRTAAFVDGGYMGAAFGHDQGFELYEDFSHTGLSAVGPAAMAWIDEHADETFFVLIHTYDVHWPYDPPEPHRSAFLAGLDPPTPGFEPTGEVLEALRRARGALPPNDLEYARALYDGGIRYVDAWFGGFLAHLRARGLLDRATVVVVSDHGEEFQEHGTVGHDRLYSTVTRIPLLIRLPGGAAATTVEEIVEAIDLMPTLLDLTGTPRPGGVQGRSLLPLLRGAASWTPVAIGESPFFGARRAIAAGGYRLFLTVATGEVELYRTGDDPDELHDVAAEHGPVVDRLRQGLDGWQRMVESAAVRERAAGELDPHTLESLRSLGYIDRPSPRPAPPER
jgi:arylsulfatase A-like enzyme